MSVAVKICGIMTPEHARVAVMGGADYLGLVFAPSRRQIDVQRAGEIAAAARSTGPISLVGVFVNQTPDRIREIAEAVGLDLTQLSGHESLADADSIGVPLLKAIRFDGHASEQAWLDQADQPLLIDAHVTGSFGGAGIVGDWERAAALARRRAIWLAGGLTPDNVADAVRAVQPLVVDVSSGVERDGIKDAEKITAFIRRAKSAPDHERS